MFTQSHRGFFSFIIKLPRCFCATQMVELGGERTLASNPKKMLQQTKQRGEERKREKRLSE